MLTGLGVRSYEGLRDTLGDVAVNTIPTDIRRGPGIRYQYG
jgi:hypothetical protein